MTFRFDQAQAAEFGVEKRVLATMTQTELTLRAEADASLGKKKGGKLSKKVRQLLLQMLTALS